MAAVTTANPICLLAEEFASGQLVQIGELSITAPLMRLTDLDSAPKAYPGKVLSPTQVRAFLNCSARRWFKYGLDEPEIRNSALALGSAVHQALEANFREKVITKEDLDTLGVVALFREAWHHQADEAEFWDDVEPAEIRKLGEQLVARYMDEAAPWIQPGCRGTRRYRRNRRCSGQWQGRICWMKRALSRM
jgi:hypothetical protein